MDRHAPFGNPRRTRPGGLGRLGRAALRGCRGVRQAFGVVEVD